jgi:hypothetical protein
MRTKVLRKLERKGREFENDRLVFSRVVPGLLDVRKILYIYFVVCNYPCIVMLSMIIVSFLFNIENTVAVSLIC